MNRTHAFALACLLALAAPAAAKPAYGTSVDQKCTANGWVPARPYNPNNLLTTDPKRVNCGLCHANALNPTKSLNAAGKVFKASSRQDVSPFCAPMAPLNHPPQFAAVPAQQATVGELFQVFASATDPDGDAIALSISNAPVGSTFLDLGNGTGSFEWTPSAGQTGNVVATIHAEDAGSPMASATLDIAISVGIVTNRPPVLASIPDVQVEIGATLALTFAAVDPDLDSLAFDVQPLPSGASITGNQLDWTPSAGQEGSYPVTVTVTDDGVPPASDGAALVITAGHVNRPPRLAPIGDRSVDLGQTLRIALVASDADLDRLALACTGLPSDASFTDFQDGTAEVVWMPSAAGTYSVACSASDNALPPGVAQETFSLTARDPAPPAGAPILSGARWVTDRGRGTLRVIGDVPEADRALPVEVFALLADGSAVKLGRASANGGGHFESSLRPFIAPCRVAAVANGLMGSALAVASTPASCDVEPILSARAKSSCDGFHLKVKGRRAPPDAQLTGFDGATGDPLFTLQTTQGGRFHTRVAVNAFVRSIAIRVEAAGQSWTLPVVVQGGCD